MKNVFLWISKCLGCIVRDCFIPQKKSDQRDTFTLNNQLQEDLASVELPMIYAQPGSRQNPSSITPAKDSPSQRIIDFFFTLAACNTVIVAKYPHHDQVCFFSISLMWMWWYKLRLLEGVILMICLFLMFSSFLPDECKWYDSAKWKCQQFQY